jgi:hypothetical protein
MGTAAHAGVEYLCEMEDLLVELWYNVREGFPVSVGASIFDQDVDLKYHPLDVLEKVFAVGFQVTLEERELDARLLDPVLVSC